MPFSIPILIPIPRLFLILAGACAGTAAISGLVPVCLQSATAQETKSEIAAPRGPLVINAGKGAQWSVAIEYAQPPPGAAYPVRLEMKTGLNSIQQGTVTHSDGTARQFYIIEGTLFQLVTRAGKEQIITRLPADNTIDPSYTESLSVTGFPAVGWLSTEQYAGTEKLGNTLCYVYILRSGKASASASSGSAGEECKAWISTADRSPMRVVAGNRTYAFSPVSPWLQDIRLPQDFASKAERMQKQARALERLRAMSQN